MRALLIGILMIGLGINVAIAETFGDNLIGTLTYSEKANYKDAAKRLDPDDEYKMSLAGFLMGYGVACNMNMTSAYNTVGVTKYDFTSFDKKTIASLILVAMKRDATAPGGCGRQGRLFDKLAMTLGWHRD